MGMWLRLGHNVLGQLDGLVAGLEGVILCEDVAHVLHARLCALRHDAKDPAGRYIVMVRCYVASFRSHNGKIHIMPCSGFYDTSL